MDTRTLKQDLESKTIHRNILLFVQSITQVLQWKQPRMCAEQILQSTRMRRKAPGGSEPEPVWEAACWKLRCTVWDAGVHRFLVGLLGRTGKDGWPLRSSLAKKVTCKGHYLNSALVCKTWLRFFFSRVVFHIKLLHLLYISQGRVVRYFLPQA